MSDKLRWFLTAIRPGYWIQTHPYCREWDRKLNELLDAGEHFTSIDGYMADIGGIRVWIGNHPYASFLPQGKLPEMRPRRRTIVRAWEQLMRDAFNALDGTGEVSELNKLWKRA